MDIFSTYIKAPFLILFLYTVIVLNTTILVYAQHYDREQLKNSRWGYLKYPSQTEKNIKQSNKEKSDSGNTGSYNYKTGNSNNKILQSLVNLPDIVIEDFGGNPDFYHSENSIFISPVNLDIVLNSNNFNEVFLDTPCGQGMPALLPHGVSAQTSIDGGQNWSGTTGILNNSLGDPTVVIGNNGIMYIGYVTIEEDTSCNPIGKLNVSWSDDGIIWNEVLVYEDPPPFDLQDKPHLWIDNRQFKQDGTVNLNEGNLYIAWTDWAVSPKEILFSRSTDDGLTWSSTMQISAGVTAFQLNFGVNIETGPNGEVYVCWAVYDVIPCDGGDVKAIGFTKSLDGGITWDVAQRVINNIEGIDSWQCPFSQPLELSLFKTMRVNSFPVMTVNQQNGEMYIVWTNRGFPGINVGDPDIYLIKSIDKGVSWGTPIRVNQDTIGNNKDQWFPWIACDETSGALVVIYYDSRNFPFPINSRAETYVSISYDGGNSWEDHLISDTDWSGNGFVIRYAGEYIGIDVSHGRAVPVWSDDRTGNMLAYTQPFDVPCPADLTLCNAIITEEAAYNVTNNITVGGPGCNYIIRNTANVKMEAGNEIVISGEFVSEGEFIAQINPACTVFGQKKGHSNESYSNPIKNENDNAEIQKGITKDSSDFAGNEIRIFPNPNNGRFTLYVPSIGEQTMVYIEDILGRIIYEAVINKPRSVINISSRLQGVYFVKIYYEGNLNIKKVIIQ